jgi:hypothetical protein
MKRLLLVSLLLLAGLPAVAAPPIRIITEFEDGTKQVYVPEEPVVEPDDPPPPPPPVDPPPPPPPPVTPTKKSNIGINLADHRYYSTERVFNDLAKQGSVWQWSNSVWNGAQPGPTDVNGYPSSVPSGVFAGMVLDMHTGLPRGQYRFAPTTGVTVDNQLSPGLFAKATDNQRIIVRVRQGIQSLSIREVGNDDPDVFYKPFLERIKPFGCLRMMNWGQTNLDRPVSWQTRTTPNWYTQSQNEVALEYQVDAALACDSALWVCVHHRADDAYIREMARFLKARWKSTQPLYVEWSNETWNSGFAVYRYCVDRADKTRINGTPGSPLEYASKRTAEMARIFNAEGCPATIVFGAQAVASDHAAWVFRHVPFPVEIEAVAIAPYFGYAIKNKTGTVDQILDECSDSIDANAVHISNWKAFARARGVQLCAYEGGQHLAASIPDQSNATIVSNYTAANRHPRMYDLYRRYLKQWDSLTDRAPMVLFNSCYQSSKHGSWGLWEYEGQLLREAHKARAVMDHISTAP